ncbi:MAG: FGGY-family carbohydrate kinase [Ktedonobacteraceae bacterium]
MASTDYVIGIDCSTTATKAVVWDLNGAPIADGRATFPLSTPQPGWHEQDAEDWWRATRTALREAAAKVDISRIKAIGLTHQRESFVCVNADGRPLRAAILWLDARSADEVARYGSEHIHQITGKPPDPTPALYKLYWLRNHEPGLLERTAKVVDVHAFLVHCFTGHWRTSWASADPLGLIDMQRFDWSDEILRDLGITREQMCELVPPGAVVGGLKPDVAQELGLRADLPIVAGAGDGQTAGLGANITEPGKAYLNLGTAIVSGAYSDHYAWGREFRTLAGPIPRTYTLETLLRGGTYTISWFVDQFSGVRAADLNLGLGTEQILEAAASQVAPGAEGLLLLPYWNTCATPYWDAQACGTIFGWRGHHGKAHMYRALLEGLAFEQRLGTDGMEKGVGRPIERLLAMGGGSRSPLFCQIMADIVSRPVTVCREAEATCLGAGMFGAAGVGAFRDMREAATAMSGEGATFQPDPKRAAFYDRLYTDVYKELYPRLAPLFPALANALRVREEISVAGMDEERSMPISP